MQPESPLVRAVLTALDPPPTHRDRPHPNVAALRGRAINEGRSITRAELAAAVEADLGCELPGSAFRPPPGPAH